MAVKHLSRFIDIVLYFVVGITFTASICSVVWGRPIFFTSVRSNSMYPLFERSDLLILDNLSESDTLDIGDIIVFHVEEGSLSSQDWIVHRIIDGDAVNGYITKGDANEYTDQASGDTKTISRDWIVSRVITVGGQPLKVPLVGYLSLWMEKLQTNPYVIPMMVVLLAVIIGICELRGDKKRRKKNKNLEMPFVYLLGGLTISIIMAASMLATSERLIVRYDVSENAPGIISGSDVGILVIGEEINKPLTELRNKGFFPIIATVTTDDRQITFSSPYSMLRYGGTINTEMAIRATQVGSYNSIIHVGMFYPFLPAKLIYRLSSISYWLALSTISIVPGLPLILYPVIDRKLRKKAAKAIRYKLKGIHRRLAFIRLLL
jgi:signal peptidase